MRLPARVLVPLMLLAVALMALLSRGGHLPASAQLPPESPTPIPTMPPEPFAPGGRAVPIPQPTAMPPIRPLPPVPPLGLVRLDRFTATVDIQDQTAFTAVDLDFRNNGDRQDEATLLFPIPPGVAVSDFTMTVNGETLEGELIGREEAARIYTSIVASRRDPALLEYAGQNLLRARVFPVPPRGESRLTIRFTQLLERENGAVRYRLPLTAGADVGPTLSKLALNVTVSGSQGVLSLFSPSHPIKSTRVSATEFTATYEEANTPLRGALELNALMSDADVAAGIISYKTRDDDGYFMLWLAPRLRQEAIVEKDVILVLDVSGSMAGQKITQAKAALTYVLSQLNPGDRFNIVPFSSAVDVYAPELQGTGQVSDAMTYVNRLRAEGGTNINEALATGIRLINPDRFTTVLFLTDGQPTNGEQNITRILENARAALPTSSRLFVFGVGDDVNTQLLDGLAVQNRGDVVYVRPSENVESAVSTLYNRISAPQLTSLRVSIDGAQTSDMYPRPLPDLFGGQTLFITGRYRAGGAVSVTLTGDSRDGGQVLRFDNLTLAEEDRRASYLPKLWAQRKIGSLLREIPLAPPAAQKELIDTVAALGNRFGIATPYNSFLVLEPGLRQPVAVPGTADPLTGAVTTRVPTATPTRVATPAPATGSAAVSAAATAAAFSNAAPAPAAARPAAPGQSQGAAGGFGASAAVETVGDRSFVRRDGVWVDTGYEGAAPTTKIVFGSDEYVALLLQYPDLAPVLALGDRIIFIWQGVVYEIVAGS